MAALPLIAFDVDETPLAKARMLRELAVWYRRLASRTANPVIWESRLLMAKELDAEAQSNAGDVFTTQPRPDVDHLITASVHPLRPHPLESRNE
jgi:hypothetical protein